MSAFGRLRKVGQAGIAAAMLMLVNCSTSSQKLTEISLGMTKTQVVERLGRPSAARGAISNRYGQDIEVWEYELSTPKQETAGSILGKSALTVFTLGIGAVAFRPETAGY